MNSFLAINGFTKTLAGVLAMLATVVVLGAPLTLAEYYAETGAADHLDACALADKAEPAIRRNT